MSVENKRRADGGTPASSPTFTRAGIQIVFALLIREDLVRAPLRTIAHAANVSLGSVHTILNDLDRRGFLAGGTTHRSGLRRRDTLISEWVSAFTDRSPTGRDHRFVGPEPQRVREMVAKHPHFATLAGEVNHPTLVVATTSCLYVTEPYTELIKTARLKRGDHPNVTIRHRFWNEDALGLGPSGHPLLDYAELYRSDDGRQLEVAAQIRRRFLE